MLRVKEQALGRGRWECPMHGSTFTQLLLVTRSGLKHVYSHNMSYILLTFSPTMFKKEKTGVCLVNLRETS